MNLSEADVSFRGSVHSGNGLPINNWVVEELWRDRSRYSSRLRRYLPKQGIVLRVCSDVLALKAEIRDQIRSARPA